MSNTQNKSRGTNLASARRVSTETKSSLKTTELIAYVAAVIGVLVASAVVDASDFGAQEAWFYVTLLTIGYLVSRGLAKSGSRDYYDDVDHERRNG
jgi:hypothetical protein